MQHHRRFPRACTAVAFATLAVVSLTGATTTPAPATPAAATPAAATPAAATTTPAAPATPAAAAAAPTATAPDPLVAMFVWWNAAYQQKDGFTAESFSRYFTKDAVMRINGKDRSKGLEDLAQHFRAIQADTEMVVIDLPFIDEFTSASGDRIFTHHFVRAREHGKDSRERVMGYAAIEGGKISLINFVSVPDPMPDPGK